MEAEGRANILEVMKFIERQASKNPGNAVAANYLDKLRRLNK